METIVNIINKRKKLVAVAVLLVIGLAIYANSFNNQLFWDDDDVITNNVFIKDWRFWPKFFSQSLIAGAGQVSNYWRPLLLFSFSLDYHLWGLNPVGYHFINTLLHILAACLAFVLIFKISHKHWLSFLTALFFLVHPLNTEAVTYAAGRADPLSTIFILLALIFYLDFRQKSFFWRDNIETGESDAKNNWRKIVFSVVFFVMALLVKEQAVFLPALLILAELVLISRPQEKFFRKILWLAPYAFIALVYLVLHFTWFNFNNLLHGFDYDYSQAYNSSFLIRLWTFFKIMLEYGRLLVWPTGLHMAWEVAPVMSVFSWPVALFLAFGAGLAGLAVKTWRQDRLIAFGLMWYFLLLLPRTNILKINRPMYEHWLYLPMIGFWLALFSLIILIWGKHKINNSRGKILERVGLAVILVYVLTLSWLTISRNRDWRDPITFYEKNLRYTPNSFIQHNNLGMAYAAVGKNELAIVEYRQAIAIKDVYAQVHYNLANSLAATGQPDPAAEEYRKAIIMSPTFQFPYQNLLSLYINKKDKAAVNLTLEEMKKNLGQNVYFKYAGLADYFSGDYARAIKLWRQWLEIEPNNIEARQLIAEALNKSR